MKKIKKTLALLLGILMSTTVFTSCEELENVMNFVGDISSVYEEWNEQQSGANSDSSSSSSGGSSSEGTEDNKEDESKATRVLDFTKAKTIKNVTDLSNYAGGCPTMGTVNVLVIPIQFSDITAASKGYSIDKIEKAFNGKAGDTDYASVSEYYSKSSYGKLNLQFTVYNSWFQPKNGSTYYKNYTEEYEGEDWYMGDQLILDEALASLSKTMDLSKFDSDNNDMIDAVVMVPTADVDPDTEEYFNWAYRYWNYYTDGEGYYYEYDGVSANDYMWTPYQFLYEDEYGFDNNKMMTTYTFIHEFGHILGADDYYDTANLAGEDELLGGYDVMDAMTGDHNPYTKFNYGWLTSSRLVTAGKSVTLTLEDFSKNGDTIIIANNWKDDLGVYQEYFVLMYYTSNGLNGGEYGYFVDEGILVYHVNATVYEEEYYGEPYYYIYNTNTDASNDYGTEDNLLEYIKQTDGTYVYGVGDCLSANVKDDNGTKIAYTFQVDELTDTTATITFTKNK